MSGFIDMMANDRWSEADIVNRTEAMIASEFPPNEVAIINRIVTAAAAGIYELTPEEIEKVDHYNLVCLQAREAGDASRLDMVLLSQVLDYEEAKVNKAQAEANLLKADAVLALATDAVLALVEQRTVPEPVQEETPTNPNEETEV